MARFSLSLFTVFLVLAAFAIALPTKRDADQASDPLAGTLGMLDPVTNIMQDLGLDSQPSSSAHASAASATSAPTSTPSQRAASKPDRTQQGRKMIKPAVGEPTKTDKEPYTGNFVTPTASETPAHHYDNPSPLDKIPIVGKLLKGGGLF
ncbi:hypothetical protein N7474_008668 [Penicillium riverlandense]|uniref:uncharacterized protein n=1 Tax=Penicillium riverlandense TaxID=1903569 RepID=UPI0025490FDE|nr:uncharacterized protein N7474_008668 [Penicillium riverlandense]KAJ5812367.1 hypothetical protein N7474_008668 [Penicillium riverlandense]